MPRCLYKSNVQLAAVVVARKVKRVPVDNILRWIPYADGKLDETAINQSSASILCILNKDVMADKQTKTIELQAEVVTRPPASLVRVLPHRHLALATPLTSYFCWPVVVEEKSTNSTIKPIDSVVLHIDEQTLGGGCAMNTIEILHRTEGFATPFLTCPSVCASWHAHQYSKSDTLLVWSASHP